MMKEGTSIFIIVLLVFEATESTSKERQNECRELMIHDQKVLNCSHRNLQYIPKTKKHVMDLMFSYNNLTNITSQTFENISDPDNLISLELDHNKINNISKGAIGVFQNLKLLHLSNNPIYYQNMKDLLGVLSNLKFLSRLHMGRISTVTIQKDLFSLMTKNRINTLDVTFYNMETISMDVFSSFNSLAVLYLNDNHIENIILSKSKRLKHLYLYKNKLNSFPDFSINGSEKECYFPNLEILSVVSNNIKAIGFNHLNCLLKLNKLELDQNPIQVLQSNLLSKLPNIEILKIRYLRTETLTVEPLAFKSKSLKQLELTYERPAKEVFESFNVTFKLVPNLRILKLGLLGMLSLTNEQFSALFSPLANISIFKCFACQISQDPNIILKHMPNVVDFNLQGNRITTISNEAFKNKKHLRYIDLRLNDIAHIKESALPISLLNKLYSLDLSQNPFVCDCSLEWVINWMKTKRNKKVISRYPQGYVCSLPTDKSKRRLSDISFTYKECHPWSPWIWFAFIASPCVIVIGITTLVLYRNRWNIKHYIYLLRKRRNYEIINGHNFVYDAFVGYEAEDSAWVRRRLLPVLEDEVGLKLCIHERDFQPGAFINDNIVTNMDKSAKVILVISNTFACSGWCMFELKIHIRD